ncbi:hypothetical protein GWK47_031655 [Chionoecetes opilio]|uniref:Uncharacterized protein n=1 Tax=Chionoecetes opilio TaxID=41210 RepID=A0A8J5D216_CHIOP|nr:hypothetical protein GWK47_031655 [Chionoecetes opilio]
MSTAYSKFITTTTSEVTPVATTTIISVSPTLSPTTTSLNYSPTTTSTDSSPPTTTPTTTPSKTISTTTTFKTTPTAIPSKSTPATTTPKTTTTITSTTTTTTAAAPTTTPLVTVTSTTISSSSSSSSSMVDAGTGLMLEYLPVDPWCMRVNMHLHTMGNLTMTIRDESTDMNHAHQLEEEATTMDNLVNEGAEDPNLVTEGELDYELYQSVRSNLKNTSDFINKLISDIKEGTGKVDDSVLPGGVDASCRQQGGQVKGGDFQCEELRA